jgi:NTP pyrophosphatase (non-canonical NTP hydrolase)
VRAPTIGEMTAAIRQVNIDKGWRPADGRTFGDDIALLHTEIGETTDAYRKHLLEDATKPPTITMNVNDLNQWVEETGPAKPEGVGSELADVLIRLLDIADRHGFAVADRDSELADIAEVEHPEHLPPLVTFGDHTSWLHHCADNLWQARPALFLHAGIMMLRTLVTVAATYNINLEAEYTRKLAYNRTRPWRHGGRNL